MFQRSEVNTYLKETEGSTCTKIRSRNGCYVSIYNSYAKRVVCTTDGNVRFNVDDFKSNVNVHKTCINVRFID